jgi:hypothetical protein
MSKMSEANPLEQILNEKAGLEEESQKLDKTQKILRQKAKVLAEKIILEMKKRNNVKQDIVNKLQSQISELETQLSKLSASNASKDSDFQIDENKTDKIQTFVELEASIKETGEETLTVIAVDEEEISESANQQKKKRQLF